LQLSSAQKYEGVHILAAAEQDIIGNTAKVQFFTGRVTAYKVQLKHDEPHVYTLVDPFFLSAYPRLPRFKKRR
jgi:hypothetical protein